MSGPALRRDDTGFLLLPLAALVFSAALLLAVVFGLSVLARPGCDLGDVFAYPCSDMGVRMSNFFNLMAVPGVVVFAWQTRLHRRRTRPLEPGVFAAAEPVVARVLDSVTLPRPTPVVLGPRLGRRAFTGGTAARPYVALGPELLALPAKGEQGRAVFEAVLRHELAHVRNHDLLRLRFATVLRISTRVTAGATALLLLAELLLVPRPVTAGGAGGVVLRAALVALGAELAVRAFLRVRERQADRRAAEGDPAAIRAALHGGRDRAAGLWERLLSPHPSVAHRLAALGDDAGSLALPLGQVLAGGVFAAIALTNVQLLVDLLYDAKVVRYPGGDQVAWVSQAILATAAVPVAFFLAYGCWRDAGARRLAGRPARPGLLGVLFGAGLLAGTYLAPYVALVHPTRGVEVPVLPGLVVFAAAGALLCRWLVALGERAAPATARHRRLLLVPAVPVGAGALLLAWDASLRLRVRGYECDVYGFADCGPLDAARLTAAAVGTPLGAAVLTLAVLTLLAVTARRAGRPAAVTAGAAAVGCLLAVALPRLPGADTLALDFWPGLAGPLQVLPLQVAAVVAVVLAGPAPRPSAGPLAGAAALLVLGAGLDGQLARWADGPTPTAPGDVTSAVGLFLGWQLAVVLLAVVATLAVRDLADRVRAARPVGAVPAPRRYGKPRLSSPRTSDSDTGRAGVPGTPGAGPPPRS